MSIPCRSRSHSPAARAVRQRPRSDKSRWTGSTSMRSSGDTPSATESSNGVWSSTTSDVYAGGCASGRDTDDPSSVVKISRIADLGGGECTGRLGEAVDEMQAVVTKRGRRCGDCDGLLRVGRPVPQSERLLGHTFTFRNTD